MPDQAPSELLVRQTAYLEAIVNHLPHGISVFDEHLRLQYWNAQFIEVLELPPEAVVRGVSLDALLMYPALRGEFGPGDPVKQVAERRRIVERFAPHRLERTRPNGRTHLVSGEPLFVDGQIAGLITTFIDITDRKRAEERIEHLAHHDPLTGLANRLSLDEYLHRVFAARKRDRGKLAVLFLDLDNFKTINDSLGHHVGDGLLVEVGRRLRSAVRASDMVARLGGDEFVVVLGSVTNDGGAAHAADKLLACLSEPYSIGEDQLHTTPSIGISLFPDDGNEPAVLMRNADTAMYHAKAQGRANFQFHSDELNQSAVQRLELERKLRKAVKEGEFELWFQPIFAARDLRLTSMEALVRWRHPQDGLIPPARFIAVAEETGLIVPLGQWVLEAACRQARRWLDAGLPALRIAVNLSLRQLRSLDIVDSVAAALETNALPRGTLELELTESSVMERPEEAAALLVRLKGLGVAVSIDDFGTGHSSLAYLKRFPLDHLKIDRSFVSEIERDASDAAIVAAAVSLAHNLGLSVIAEGVETAVQVERLSALGCDELQGYHFSTPLPADEAEALIRSAGAGEVPIGAQPRSNLG